MHRIKFISYSDIDIVINNSFLILNDYCNNYYNVDVEKRNNWLYDVFNHMCNIARNTVEKAEKSDKEKDIKNLYNELYYMEQLSDLNNSLKFTVYKKLFNNMPNNGLFQKKITYIKSYLNRNKSNVSISIREFDCFFDFLKKSYKEYVNNIEMKDDERNKIADRFISNVCEYFDKHGFVQFKNKDDSCKLEKMFDNICCDIIKLISSENSDGNDINVIKNIHKNIIDIVELFYTHQSSKESVLKSIDVEIYKLKDKLNKRLIERMEQKDDFKKGFIFFKNIPLFFKNVPEINSKTNMCINLLCGAFNDVLKSKENLDDNSKSNINVNDFINNANSIVSNVKKLLNEKNIVELNEHDTQTFKSEIDAIVNNSAEMIGSFFKTDNKNSVMYKSLILESIKNVVKLLNDKSDGNNEVVVNTIYITIKKLEKNIYDVVYRNMKNKNLSGSFFDKIINICNDELFNNKYDYTVMDSYIDVLITCFNNENTLHNTENSSDLTCLSEELDSNMNMLLKKSKELYNTLQGNIYDASNENLSLFDKEESCFLPENEYNVVKLNSSEECECDITLNTFCDFKSVKIDEKKETPCDVDKSKNSISELSINDEIYSEEKIKDCSAKSEKFLDLVKNKRKNNNKIFR